MKLIRYIFVLISGMSICLVFANEGKSGIDSTYIEEYKYNISLTQRIFRKDIGLSIKEKSLPSLKYTINSRIKLGYHFAWRAVVLGFAINLPDGNEDKFGKTKTFDLRTDFLIKNKFLFDLYLVRSVGMHLSNPSAHIEAFDRSGVYPQYDNLKANQLGIDVGYIFNSTQYSYEAAFGQNVRQLKSAGSFMVGGYLYYIRMDNQNVMYPRDAVTDFQKLDSLTGFTISTVGVEGGYAHNFVMKRYGLIGLAGSVGLGIGDFTKKMDEHRDNDFHVSGRFKVKLITGYHGVQHSGGVQFSLDALRTNYSDDVRAASILGYTGIYYRFEFSTKRFRKKV